MEQIIKEIKAGAVERNLPTLPYRFEEFYGTTERYRFPKAEFIRRADALQADNQVNYDIPIEGKFSFVKKFIRKLYEFHMRVLWTTQNRINLESAWTIYEIKNYICNKENIDRTEIVKLNKRCEEQEQQIAQLRKELERL